MPSRGLSPEGATGRVPPRFQGWSGREAFGQGCRVTEPTPGGAKQVVPPIGQLAVLRRLITQPQLDAALAEQERARTSGQKVRPLGEMLIAQEFLTTAQLNALLQDVKLIGSISASSDEPAPFSKP